MLTGMRSVRVRYHPHHGRNRVAHEFLTRAQGRRALEANPACDLKVEVVADGPVIPPTIEIQYDNNEVQTFDASRMKIQDIVEQIKDTQEAIEFQFLRQEYAEEQDDEEDGEGYLTAWNMNESFDDPFSVEDVRKGQLMNATRNPTSVARREFNKAQAEYHKMQRQVKGIEARAKLDPSLAKKLADVKKVLAVEDARWADYAAKVKASEPASKAAHSKAPGKKPAAPPK